MRSSQSAFMQHKEKLKVRVGKTFDTESSIDHGPKKRLHEGGNLNAEIKDRLSKISVLERKLTEDQLSFS